MVDCNYCLIFPLEIGSEREDVMSNTVFGYFRERNGQGLSLTLGDRAWNEKCRSGFSLEIAKYRDCSGG